MITYLGRQLLPEIEKMERAIAKSCGNEPGCAYLKEVLAEMRRAAEAADQRLAGSQNADQ